MACDIEDHAVAGVVPDPILNELNCDGVEVALCRVPKVVGPKQRRLAYVSDVKGLQDPTHIPEE